ncbi:MAG TPA: hypothetical protein PKU79_11995, partial [Mesotoga sp.]|nr:hypothetical protein [Mesotoga sp.]
SYDISCDSAYPASSIVYRKNFTFIAEADLSLRKQLALIAHVDAILPPRDTAGTVLFVKSLPFQVVFHRLITDAQTAIHTAWSD